MLYIIKPLYFSVSTLRLQKKYSLGTLKTSNDVFHSVTFL